jgi:hypothetical protein
MAPNPLQEGLHQSFMQFILNRKCESLKSWNKRFQPDMLTYLSNKTIIPMPAKARDYTVRR